MEFDDKAYAKALQNLILQLEGIHADDTDEISKVLRPFAPFLRLGHAEAMIYDDTATEQRGLGSRVTYYSDGNAAYSDMEATFTRRDVFGPGRITHYAFYHKAGEPDWDDEERERLLVLSNLLNVFNRRMMTKKLGQYHATHEQDFGLYNVPYAARKIAEYSARHILGEFGACYFNIKRLSFINQEYGRDRATEILKAFLYELQKLFTDSREILARFGGDNFMLVFCKKNMDALFDFLHGTDIHMDDGEHETVHVTAYIGAYLLPDSIKSPNDVIDAISFALTTAKRQQATGPVFFDEQMKMRYNENKRVQFMYTEAAQNEEFKVYYQPKVNIRDYSLAGAEALCRWVHDGKMIMPGQFIPALEQSIKIRHLDFYMLEHVCRDIRQWLDEGKEVVRVSVNLSRRQFADKNLLEHVLEAIDKYHVPHDYIEIELTETSTDVSFNELRAFLAGLKKEGIHTSVDDFGSGYSSLNLIRELPWDVLKLDKSFLDTKDKADGRKAQMMFSHIIALARELGMECITEGVETVEQISMLKENNCYLAQGYYFDKPLPKEEFEKRLMAKTKSII